MIILFLFCSLKFLKTEILFHIYIYYLIINIYYNCIIYIIYNIYNISKQNSKIDEYEKIIMGLNEEIEELKMNVDGLEKERNFYFGKLREIEILVQTQIDVRIE